MAIPHLLKGRTDEHLPSITKGKRIPPIQREEDIIYLKGRRMSSTFIGMSMGISHLLKKEVGCHVFEGGRMAITLLLKRKEDAIYLKGRLAISHLLKWKEDGHLPST